MTKYYFLGTILPPLSFDAPPEISFNRLDVLMRDNLTPNDYKKLLFIRHFYDLLNLRSLWLEEEIDPRGELSRFALQEALVDREGLPEYVYDYLDRYQNKEDRIHHFPFLLANFFQQAESLKDPFLRHYLNFERELRLVLTAFRAKKMGRDLSVELQYEDPEEDLIAQMLAQQDAESYEPPEKFKDLKALFEKYGDNPLALQRALDEYRFEKIENLVDMADVFSIDRLLAYVIQFVLIENKFAVDKEKGIQIIEAIAKLDWM